MGFSKSYECLKFVTYKVKLSNVLLNTLLIFRKRKYFISKRKGKIDENIPINHK